ncbi:hypothetical protein L0222_16880 [bacterium]|nr:hypothetical protein [bacterium]
MQRTNLRPDERQRVSAATAQNFRKPKEEQQKAMERVRFFSQKIFLSEAEEPSLSNDRDPNDNRTNQNASMATPHVAAAAALLISIFDRKSSDSQTLM